MFKKIKLYLHTLKCLLYFDSFRVMNEGFYLNKSLYLSLTRNLEF